jgi:hypothetical protein
MGQNVEAYRQVMAGFHQHREFRARPMRGHFSRPDGTHGFEEFRHDVKDRGEWTPVAFYSGSVYASREAALRAAMRSVTWLDDAIKHSPSAQRLLSPDSN